MTLPERGWHAPFPPAGKNHTHPLVRNVVSEVNDVSSSSVLNALMSRPSHRLKLLPIFCFDEQSRCKSKSLLRIGNIHALSNGESAPKACCFGSSFVAPPTITSAESEHGFLPSHRSQAALDPSNGNALGHTRLRAKTRAFAGFPRISRVDPILTNEIFISVRKPRHATLGVGCDFKDYTHCTSFAAWTPQRDDECIGPSKVRPILADRPSTHATQSASHQAGTARSNPREIQFFPVFFLLSLSLCPRPNPVPEY